MIGATAVALLLVGAPPAGEVKTGVRWEKNFEQALKRARAAKKPLMVDFWASWCGWCRRLDKTTYVDPLVVRMAEDFVPVKVNTEGGPREAAIALRYDVNNLPTIVFLSPSGRPLLHLNGYQGPGQFPVTLEKARETAGRVMGWEMALERTPKDPAALMALGEHLFDQESYAESKGLLERAAKLDTDRPALDRKKTRLLLAIIFKSYEENYKEAEGLLKDALAIRPAGTLDAKILYVLGKTYLSWGKPQQARAVLQEIVSAHGESPMAQKARETLLALDRK